MDKELTINVKTALVCNSYCGGIRLLSAIDKAITLGLISKEDTYKVIEYLYAEMQKETLSCSNNCSIEEITFSIISKYINTSSKSEVGVP